MLNKLLSTREQKYQLALFGVLIMSSAISIGLFAARIAPSKNGPYTSLIWNLLLAWVPFLFAWSVFTFTRLPKMLPPILVGVCAIFWLIFFPNAFYLLTDYQHIALRDTATPVWYDVIMLHWFSWSGLFLGLMSLYFMQKVTTRWAGKAFGWVFAIGAILLGSLGIYVGRFMYRNSWDLLVKPFTSLREIFTYAMQNRDQTLTFSIPFALFFLFVYVALCLFGQLFGEHHNQE